MSKTKVLLFKSFILVFLLQNFIFGQNYFVGFSKETINPNSTILSSPLAGFGDPKQGRFSINFIETGTAKNVVAMCSSDTKLYIATGDNKLWQADISSGDPNWILIGPAFYVTALTYGNGKLYGADKNNKLWMRDAVENDNPWVNIGSAYNTTGLTFLNNKLYGTTKNNNLWVREATPVSSPWTNLGKANSVRSLTTDGTNLIALSKYDNELWTRSTSSSPNEKWLKIGPPNRTTYGTYLSNITYTKDKLYASSNNNKLYYSQHNQTPIYAYASYFEKNSKKALIITLDLCGINYSFSHAIKAEIKNLFNIDENAILINCSHTHYAPVSQNYSCLQEFYQKPNPKYLDLVKNSVLTATQNAINNKTNNSLSFAKGKTNIGYNRADITKDLDNNITMVIAKQSSTNIANGAILSASTHPVSYNQARDFIKISSNYVGATRDKLGALKNINNVQLMQGCAGDINPYNSDTPDQTANKLTQDFSNLFSLSSSNISGEITVKFDSIAVPLNNFTFNRAVSIKKANTGKYDQASERNVRWANKIINQYTSGTLSQSATVYIQILKIGDWNIIALSREAVSQYAIDLYNHFPALKLTVLGYSNDVSSYLPVQWHIKKPIPNYEGYESFFIYGESGIPVNNVEDLILTKIYSMMQ
ncbi:hypothetical protein B0A69_14730 [Chryseobacterium shigense]|uniref:Uncharacterized protein n=1 Tax=Chryseobacterium shigense TaxID=297244 RepID=A0A1N7IXB9_9FLAO|nr:hypothetical protein [Chryseobacterium shigense]PQA92303.1 hypothetical protein B0A69_14730 [Chryseobacterium shigense]SIS41743.1 hypothetical protein SAMN05421639_104710 [Chryseobacterium shigense]